MKQQTNDFWIAFLLVFTLAVAIPAIGILADVLLGNGDLWPW